MAAIERWATALAILSLGWPHAAAQVPSLVRIPLPAGAELKGARVSPSGSLFVATTDTVYVRSPFAESGWEIILSGAESAIARPGSSSAPASPLAPIRALACLDSSCVLVGTESGIWEVRWQYLRPQSHPCMQYAFTATEWLAQEYVQKLFAMPQASPGPLRSFFVNASGELVPLLWRGDRWEPGDAISLAEGAADAQWQYGAGGWSCAWAYGHDILTIVTSEGAVASRVPLTPLVAAGLGLIRPTRINCTYLDAERNLLFVGTDHGLAVADVRKDSCELSGPFQKVDSLGHATIKHVRSTSGRLLVVVASVEELPAASSPLVLEALHGRPIQFAAECSELRFAPEAGIMGVAPHRIDDVLQAEDDLLWAREGNDVWEWTTAGWRRAREHDHVLGDVFLDLDTQRSTFPPIVMQWDRKSLWYLQPNEDHWYVQDVPGNRLVPDPSGQGFWTLSDPTPGFTVNNPHYVTPRGTRSTADTIPGGYSIQPARLLHDLPDGRYYAPTTAQNSLVLPNGGELLHVRGGAWERLSLGSLASAQLCDMSPGAASASTAWLAIAKMLEGRVDLVAIDVSQELSGSAIAKVDVLAADLKSMDHTLLPDSEGYVWLAEQSSEGWQARLILQHVGISRETVKLGAMPEGERPQYLLRSPYKRLMRADQIVFTQRGYIQIPDPRPVVTTDRPHLELEGFNAPQTAEPKGWRRLLPETPSDSHVCFRQVLRSPAWSNGGPDNMGWILLTAKQHSYDPGSSHYAYAFDPDDPSGTLRLIAGPERGATAPRAVAGWNPVAPEWIAWSKSQDEALTEPPLLEFIRGSRNAPLEAIHRLQERGWISDARGTRSAVELAIIGRGVALHRSPPGFAWTDESHAGCLVGFRVISSNGRSTEYSSIEGLPAELPHDANHLEAKVRAAYENWWQPDLTRAQIRIQPDGPWQSVSASSTASFELKPHETYSVALRYPDGPPGTFTEIGDWNFRTAALPTPPVPFAAYIWSLVSSGILGVIALLSINARLRRLLLTTLGRRWTFRVGESDVHVRVTWTNDGPRLSLRNAESSYSVFDTATSLRPHLRPAQSILVDVDERVFDRPWAHQIGGGWSDPLAAIGGQITAVSRRRNLKSLPGREIRYALLTHDAPVANAPLPAARMEIAALRNMFRGCPAHTVEVLRDAAEKQASPEMLLAALKGADIIHLIAHAAPDWIELTERFTVANWDEHLPVRTRVLVMHGCRLGSPCDERESLIHRFVAGGVNVIAATEDVNHFVCSVFFERLYAHFLPGRRRTGMPLSAAISAAARDVAAANQRARQPDGKWAKSVDALVLYGDPMLELAFVAPQRREPRS